mmetsp:Transcript_11625/g.31998  ORF Transcript_11625/g.31998 Transcript_11625/m.31998 type:complete len:245 (-) Transcript_11625:1207-1941(-)
MLSTPGTRKRNLAAHNGGGGGGGGGYRGGCHVGGRPARSRDDSGLGASGELSELGYLEGDVRNRLDDVKGVLGEVARRRLVSLEVHAHGGARDAGAREAEDKARARLENEADTLVLRDGAIDRVSVREHVGLGDLHAVDGCADETGLCLDHGGHHLLGARLIDTLVVITGVVVAAVLGPVRLGDVGDADERLALVGVGGGEDLQPSEHSEHAILLAHVIATGAEGLLAADEGRVHRRVREGGSA